MNLIQSDDKLVLVYINSDNEYEYTTFIADDSGVLDHIGTMDNACEVIASDNEILDYSSYKLIELVDGKPKHVNSQDKSMTLTKAARLINEHTLQVIDNITEAPNPSAEEIAIQIHGSAQEDCDRWNVGLKTQLDELHEKHLVKSHRVNVIDYLIQMGKLDQKLLIEAGYYGRAIAKAAVTKYVKGKITKHGTARTYNSEKEMLEDITGHER